MPSSRSNSNNRSIVQGFRITGNDIAKHKIINSINKNEEEILPKLKNPTSFTEIFKNILYLLLLTLFVMLFVSLIVFWSIHIKSNKISLFEKDGLVHSMFVNVPAAFFKNFELLQFIGCALFFFFSTIFITLGLELLYKNRIQLFKFVGLVFQTLIFLALGYIFITSILFSFGNDLGVASGSSAEKVVKILTMGAFALFSWIFYYFFTSKTFDKYKTVNTNPDKPTLLISIENEQQEIEAEDIIVSDKKAKKPINRIGLAMPIVLAVWVCGISLTAGSFLFLDDILSIVPALKEVLDKLFPNHETSSSYFAKPENRLLLVGTIFMSIWTYITGLKVFSFFLGSIVGELGTNKSFWGCICASITKTIQQLASIVSGGLLMVISIAGLFALLLFWHLPRYLLQCFSGIKSPNPMLPLMSLFEKIQQIVFIFLGCFLIVNDLYKHFTLGMFPASDLKIVDKDAYFAQQTSLSTISLILFLITLIIVAVSLIFIYFMNKNNLQNDDFLNLQNKNINITLLVRIIYVICIFLFFILPATIASFTVRKNYADYMFSRKYNTIRLEDQGKPQPQSKFSGSPRPIYNPN